MTQILTPCRRWYTCPSTDTCGGSSCPWWCSGLSCCSCCGCPSGWSNYCCLPSFHTMSCSTGQLGISYVAAAAFSLWNVSPQRSTSCHRTSWTKKGKLMTSTWKISDLSNNLRTEVCCVYPRCLSLPSVMLRSASCLWSYYYFRLCCQLFWNKDTLASGSKAWSEPGQSVLDIYCKSVCWNKL